MRRRIFLLAPLCAFALLSCSKSEADMNNKPGTDLATLAKFILLDPKPQSAQWSVQEGEKGSGLGPTDSAIVALLTYSAADFEMVQKAIAAGGEAGGGLMRSAPKWLPPYASANAASSDGGFDFETRARAAQPFASAPYSMGFTVTYPSQSSVLVYLITQ
jgi:hypothetical protein